MSDIGISANLTLNTQQFAAQLKSAQQMLQQFVQSAKQAMQGVNLAGGGGGGVNIPGGAAGAPTAGVGGANGQLQQAVQRVVNNTINNVVNQIQQAAAWAVANPGAGIGNIMARGIPMGGHSSALNGLPGFAGNGGGGGFGGGGGGGGGGLNFNPFSARGLATSTGVGAVVYAGLEAMRLATEFAQAGDIERHPERIQRQWDSLDSPHDVMGDPYLTTSAKALAKMRADDARHKAVNGIPVLGAPFKLLDSLTDYEGKQKDKEDAAERDRRIYLGSLDKQDEANVKAAELNHDPVRVAQLRADRQSAIDKKNYEEASPGSDAQTAAMKALFANRAISEKELAQAQASYGARIDALHGSTLQIGFQRDELAAQTRGDPLAAMRVRATAEDRRIRDEYAQRLTNANPDETRELTDQRESALAMAHEKAKAEEDKFNRDREKEAGDAEARINSIKGQAAEAYLAAQGRHREASVAELKRETAERVAELQRRAKAETDQQKKAELEELARMEEQAGIVRAKAQQVANAREDARIGMRADADLRQADLYSMGAGRMGRLQAVKDRYDQEMSDADTPAKREAAQKRYQAGLEREYHNQDLEDRDLELQTIQANANNANRPTFGKIEALRERLRRMTDDAAGDPKRMALVKQYGLAQLEEIRRSSQQVVGYSNAEQFSHDFGNAIGNSQLDALSRRLIDTTQGELNGAHGNNGKIGDDLDRSAKAMEDAAKSLRGKTVIVIRGGA